MAAKNRLTGKTVALPASGAREQADHCPAGLIAQDTLTAT
jgi:hypothetical protein